MARMINTDTIVIPGSNFKFSAVRTEHLGASEYTLVNIGIDVTGSVDGFENDLRKCLIAMIESCKKSPRSENLLVRVFLFNTCFVGGIKELHGFKPLADIDTNAYGAFVTGGATNLIDAVYSAVGSTNAYAKQLYDDDFMCNGINVVITDGADNDSTMTVGAIKREIKKGVTAEFIESDIILLVGINTAQYKSVLQAFQKDAGIDKYIDAGDVTPGKLAKLADFVSQSVSSQSQALGTGGPSQQISATI
mgnify:FL=1|jgi:uncharacterized protein YegL